jgi:hypothetical protein
LPAVLYGCGTRYLALREEHRLRTFENRELRRMHGLRRDDILGGWTKLHKEEVHILFSPPYTIRKIKIMEDEMHRACSTYEGEYECIQGLGGKARRKETTRKT